MAEPVDKPHVPRSGGTPPKAPTPAGQEAPRTKSERPGGPQALLGMTISDRYRIERLLGEGGMGAVYQAEHTLMRKRMAIKVLHPEMTRLPEVVARFEREAMAAAHIDHPHVVTATDFGKLDDGSFFLALEFVEGKSLREVIAQGPLELGRALHIGRQMAGALQRAHALKIVHRDLKPENVMLVDREGDADFVKVLDFGIAKVQIGELGTNEPAAPGAPILTQAGMVYGTPEYMAPEQALGQPVDARADLYALGCIMYEMIAGVRPFDAESKVALLGMQVTAPMPPFAQKAPDANVPPEVEALIKKLLAKEAAERTAEAREVIDAISNVLTHLSATGRIDGRYAPPPGSGLLTNPGLISGISPGIPDIAAARAETGKVTIKSGGVLGGSAWIVAAVAGTLGIVVLVTTIFIVLRNHDAHLAAGDGGVVLTTDGGKEVVVDEPLDKKVKEAIAMIDRGDYGSGIKALEELGDDVRGREDVHRALLAAYSATDHSKEAMREAGAILKSNPNLALKDEVKLRVEVRDTALKEGTRDASQKAAVDEAFSLLEDQMGTIGWDDLYDIAYGTSGQQYPKAASRAKTSLLRGDRSKMSPGLAVTVDLQAAGPTCSVKNFFDRAAEKGDERTLALLKPLVAPRIAGHFRKTDVLACIHADGSLNKTIGAIEDRLRALKRK